MEIFPFSSARGPRLTLSTKASRWLDENLIISYKLLITKSYCELFVEKRFELRSEVCDMTGHLPFFGRCPFLFYPRQRRLHPTKSHAHGGRRTQKKTAARHPLGLLRVERFGSVFFTPLSIWNEGVGQSKGKGELNTIKNINHYVNSPLRLLAMGWAKAVTSVKKILADFLFCDGFCRCKSECTKCVLLQWQNKGPNKKYNKIFSFLQLLPTEEMAFIFWRVFLHYGLDLLFAFASFKFYFSKGANCKEQMKDWAKTMTKNKKGAIMRDGTGGKII